MKNLRIAKLVYTRRVCFRLFYIKPTIFPPKLCKSKLLWCAFFFLKKKIILDNDDVVCWGYNIQAQLGAGHTILQIGDSGGEMGDALTTVNFNGPAMSSTTTTTTTSKHIII